MIYTSLFFCFLGLSVKKERGVNTSVIAPLFCPQSLDNLINYTGINNNQSIVELAKTRKWGSITFVAVGYNNIPSDSPFINSQYGIFIIFNIARATIFAINILGEFYTKIASGEQFTYNDWEKIN